MADWNKLLKYWAMVEADMPYFADTVMSRCFIKYPEEKQLCDNKVMALATGDVPGNHYVTYLGMTRLGYIGDQLRLRGNDVHMNLSNSGAARITEQLLEVMAEHCGLDGSAGQDLKKVLAGCWEDIRVICKRVYKDCKD